MLPFSQAYIDDASCSVQHIACIAYCCFYFYFVQISDDDNDGDDGDGDLATDSFVLMSILS